MPEKDEFGGVAVSDADQSDEFGGVPIEEGPALGRMEEVPETTGSTLSHYWDKAQQKLVTLAPRFNRHTIPDALDVMDSLSPERFLAPPGVIAPDDLSAPSREPTPAEQRATGVYNATAEAVNSMTSPVGIATLGMGVLPKAAQVGITAAFLGQTAKQTEEAAKQAGEVSVTGTPEQKAEAYTSLGIQPAMGAMIGHQGAKLLQPRMPVPGVPQGSKGPEPVPEPGQPAPEVVPAPLPRTIEKTVGPDGQPIEVLEINKQKKTALVRPEGQPEAAPSVVPLSEVTTKEVPVEVPAEQKGPDASSELAPEEKALTDAAAESNRKQGLDSDIEVVSEEAQAGETPDIMYVRGGKIFLNLPVFRRWLGRISPNQRQAAVESLLNEEGVHLGVRKAVGDASVSELWKSLTKTEQNLVKRSYFGKEWRKAADVKPLSDAQMGHEYIRRLLQWGMNVNPTELAASKGKGLEWITQKGIDVALKGIDAVRRALPTESGRNVKAMLDQVEANLNAVKEKMPANGGEKLSAKAGLEDYPVQIEDAEGNKKTAYFNGYYDLRPAVEEPMVSVGYKLPDGTLTHGMVGPGEKVIGKIPSFDEWKAMPEKAEKLSAKAEETADEVAKMSPEQFMKFSESRASTGGFTKVAHDIGRDAPSAEFATELKARADQFNREFAANRQAMQAETDMQKKLALMNKGASLSTRAQFFQEAHDYALADPKTSGGQWAIKEGHVPKFGPQAKGNAIADAARYRQALREEKLIQPFVKPPPNPANRLRDMLKITFIKDHYGNWRQPSAGETEGHGVTVREQNSLRDITSGPAVWHETDTMSAVRLFADTERQFKRSWTRLLVSDNPDLAIGQKAQGVTLEFDPMYLNGWEHQKPGTSDLTGREYYVDRSMKGSVRAITFKRLASLEAFKKRVPGFFDYDNPSQTEGGYRVERKVKPEVASGEEKLSAKGPVGKAVDELNNRRRALGTLWRGRVNRDVMDQTIDAADNKANVVGQQMGNRLRIGTDKLRREATMAVVEAGNNPNKLTDFLTKAQAGGNEDAVRAVRYAQANWASLQADALRVKRILDGQISQEQGAGISTEYRDAYVPHIYDRDLLMGSGRPFVIAGGSGTGSGFKKGRTFENVFDAIEAGYTPKTLDVADLVEHRVKVGQKIINRKSWAESLAGLSDPTDGKPLSAPLIRKSRGPGRPGYEVAPSGYRPVEILPGVRTAIHEAYLPLFNALTGESFVSGSVPGKLLLEAAGGIKHGLLVFDSFHASRIFQKLLTLAPGKVLSGKAGYERGQSLLEYADADLNRAVAENLITPEIATWVRNNRFNANLLLDNGLNVGRIQEGLYNSVVRQIPGIGTFNKWVFEKLTRGALMEAGLIELERVAAAKPGVPRGTIARQVARDLNAYFGNLGRQGIFKSKSAQDIARLVALAPQWVESMARTELKGAAQIVKGATYDPIVHKTIMTGTIGKGVAQGLIAYLIGTQVVNYITRGHSTFQNPEDNHKLDAWIPDVTGKGHGFFLSPFSVVAELTHDMLRYSSKEPTLLEAATRIAANKASPIFRAGKVLLTGRDYDGKQITDTWRRVKAAAFALAPTPIPLAPTIKGSAYPGQTQRQLTASLGFKTEPAESQTQQIVNKAKQFMIETGKRKPVMLEPAEDEPAYYKLRDLLRKDDEKGAREMLAELRKTHSPKQIMTAMRNHVKRPFTGSRANEAAFRSSLSPKDRDVYDRARDEQRQEYQQFLKLWYK